MSSKIYKDTYIYNLGTNNKNSTQKLYMTGHEIILAYHTGDKKGLSLQQRGRLRKIARHIIQNKKDE